MAKKTLCEVAGPLLSLPAWDEHARAAKYVKLAKRLAAQYILQRSESGSLKAGFPELCSGAEFLLHPMQLYDGLIQVPARRQQERQKRFLAERLAEDWRAYPGHTRRKLECECVCCRGLATLVAYILIMCSHNAECEKSPTCIAKVSRDGGGGG